MKLKLSCLQQQTKKRLAYIPILLSNWLLFLIVEVLTAGLFTDIVDGVCVPYINSPTAQQVAAYYFLGFNFILPLTLMIFCYSRIVYKLRIKVTKHQTMQ